MKKRLLIHVQFGLTNRLRVLASAYAFAKISKRELLIIWEADEHCECGFYDLFSNNDLSIHESFSFDLSELKVYDCMEATGNNPLPFVEHRIKKDIYVKTYNPINSSIANDALEYTFLTKLRPNRIVQQLINTVDQHFNVGVHIRSQGKRDAVSWEMQEGNWTSEAQKELDFARSMANEEFFKSEMRNILKTNPKTQFFIASDKPSTVHSFFPEFKNNAIWLERDGYDRSKENMQYALADLILLSRSKYILGSYFSSFSEMASRLGNVDLRSSAFDFGSILDCYYQVNKNDFHLLLKDVDLLISRLRAQRASVISEYGMENVKIGSSKKLGNGISGYAGWILRRISNFLVKRQSYFFTRTLKKIGNFLLNTGRNLIDIDRF